MPVTVHFPDYDFNENIHIYCFHEWDVFLIHVFYDRHKNQRTGLIESSEKKETFACAIFVNICYVACMINRAGQLIDQLTSLSIYRAGLIDKPALKSKVQQNDNCFYQGSYCTLIKLKFYFPLKKL